MPLAFRPISRCICGPLLLLLGICVPGLAATRNQRPGRDGHDASVVHASFGEWSNVATTQQPSILETPSVTEVAETLPGGCRSCGVPRGCVCQPVGYLFDWSRSEMWVGTTALTGPASFLSPSHDEAEVGGSFGFQEGFNFSSRMPGLLSGQIGSQVGMRFTHTQLDGTTAGDDHRTQAFVTAGLFRRVDYGLQAGLVVDYLHDDWVYKADLLQLRGELSFLLSPCHDFGFRFTDSQQTDGTTAFLRGLSTPLDLRLSALESYRFFYRYRFGECGQGSSDWQAGFTEDSAAVLAFHTQVPLHGQLGLDVSGTYLLPPPDAATPYRSESWNLGMAIVWTPGRLFGTARDYYRPLLPVADNGSFLVKHL